MKVLVTGSSNGLGRALVNELFNCGHQVFTYDLENGQDVRKPDIGYLQELDVLINNAGVNRINWLESVTEEDWDTVMDTNAKGIFMMTQACLPMLITSKGTVVNIVSNAAHVPMTCSAAYNASKGAAHILTQQLARELTKRHGITVFGVAPNRMAGTEMSHAIDKQVVATRGWGHRTARKYQLQSLLVGEETQPDLVAEFIGWLLSKKLRHKFLSGCVLPYGV